MFMHTLEIRGNFDRFALSRVPQPSSSAAASRRFRTHRHDFVYIYLYTRIHNYAVKLDLKFAHVLSQLSIYI